MVIPASLKGNIEEMSYGTYRNHKDDNSYEEVCLLAWDGQRN